MPPVYVGSVAVVLKPWTERTGIIRTQDGSIPTASMPVVADMISTTAGKLPKLLGSQIRLVCLQGSGKVVANVPRAPPTPNQEVMMSTEVDSYLRAVHEAKTAKEAIALGDWDLSSPAISKGSSTGQRTQGRLPRTRPRDYSRSRR